MKNTTKMLKDDPHLKSYQDAPWPRKNMVHEDENVIVFKDGFPVTEGHLLFVPKKKLLREDITICFEYAYKWGIEGIMNYEWEAFNIGINNGVAAGQTVMWPHVHLIPRRKGDTPNPKGGVRHVIPCKGDYTEPKETIRTLVDGIYYDLERSVPAPCSRTALVRDRAIDEIKFENKKTTSWKKVSDEEWDKVVQRMRDKARGGEWIRT